MRWTISQGKCPELNNLWPHPLSLFLKTRGTKCPGPGFRQTMEINPSNSRSALDASREDIMTLWWALNCKLHVRYIKYLHAPFMSIYLNVFVHVSTLFLLHLLMTGGGQSPGRPFQVSVASVRSSLGTAEVSIVTRHVMSNVRYPITRHENDVWGFDIDRYNTNILRYSKIFINE